MPVTRADAAESPDRAADFGLVFDAGAEAMLVLDPEADQIIDANDAAARMLGHGRVALRAMAASALYPGQLPGLIVFTQGVQAKGRWWTHTLTPRHGSGGGSQRRGRWLRAAGRPRPRHPVRSR